MQQPGQKRKSRFTIDVHSHILPGIDDGSSSPEESAGMLELSYRQGVRKIVATPHFYASRQAPGEFLERRSAAFERLAPYLTEKMPEVYTGAEVYYFAGISEAEETPSLCIEGTKVILLEMPFRRWPERCIEEAINLSRDRGLTVLLAHIDRYTKHEKKDVWDRLEDNGILFQMNASCLTEGGKGRRPALRMLEDGRIFAFGSDCHNLEERSPNLGDAAEIIEKKYGRDTIRDANENAKWLLGL